MCVCRPRLSICRLAQKESLSVMRFAERSSAESKMNVSSILPIWRDELRVRVRGSAGGRLDGVKLKLYKLCNFLETPFDLCSHPHSNEGSPATYNAQLLELLISRLTAPALSHFSLDAHRIRWVKVIPHRREKKGRPRVLIKCGQKSNLIRSTSTMRAKKKTPSDFNGSAN